MIVQVKKVRTSNENNCGRDRTHDLSNRLNRCDPWDRGFGGYWFMSGFQLHRSVVRITTSQVVHFVVYLIDVRVKKYST